MFEGNLDRSEEDRIPENGGTGGQYPPPQDEAPGSGGERGTAPASPSQTQPQPHVSN
ncbi:MAG TPA: hypothetical protein VLB46_22955 [Pyrinomonadaceae bacterium]|nr:hypothetical protein [Pyrinomonadaceae bacterium]